MFRCVNSFLSSRSHVIINGKSHAIYQYQGTNHEAHVYCEGNGSWLSRIPEY